MTTITTRRLPNLERILPGTRDTWLHFQAVIIRGDEETRTMPVKAIETAYPLIDADPHASRVVRYFRPSDYAWWVGLTGAFPAALYFWEMADPTRTKMRTPLRLGGFLGFVGGFLFAYQRSSARFWGWTENQREAERDFEELSQRAREGKPLYGESNQPEWVQGNAFRNSQFSQLKFSAFPMFNFVNHQHHGTDPAKYGMKEENKEDESS